MPLDCKDLGSNSSNTAPSIPYVPPPEFPPGMVRVGPGAEHSEGRHTMGGSVNSLIISTLSPQRHKTGVTITKIHTFPRDVSAQLA